MKIKQIEFARFISIIGHPLLTIPLYILIVMFAFEDFKKASLNSLLIIGGIFLPLVLRMYFKHKNGTYTNFDVSDRIQRKSLFLFAIPFMIVVTIISFKTKQSITFSLSVLFATILVLISQIINLFVKSSLHVSLNIYLSLLMMTLYLKVGIIFLFFSGLIAWSRIVLKRHTIKEVIFGCGVGFVISLTMLYAEGFF
jgi:hypothetical protein